MTEFILFVVTGALAVVAAVLMLLSSNAVHSALFLVVTMVCIAFLFLLLNAPFLAMIQITVYAGAIMVLFIFVIMLLGSERAETKELGTPERRFRWFTPLALTLALSLLFAVGLSFVQSGDSLNSVQLPNPQVRLLNAAGDTGSVDIQFSGGTILRGFSYRDQTEFFEIVPGVWEFIAVPASGDPIRTEVTLTAGDYGTVILYANDAGLQFGFVAQDLDTVREDRSARVVVFNAYPSATSVSLIDPGSTFVEDDNTLILADLALGVASEPLIVGEGTVNWEFVNADAAAQAIVPLADYEIERNHSDLVVLTSERYADGSATGIVRPAAIQLLTAARPSFGGPQAIGYLLFTDYVLPFQLLALLLLAAMVGAIVLTHREVVPIPQRLGVRRRVSRPLVNVIASQVGHDVTSSAEVQPVPTDKPEAVES